MQGSTSLNTHGGIEVKKNYWITTIAGVALVLGIYAVPVVAQQTPPATAPQLPYLVAVIDVAQVIKAHPDFMARQEALKVQVQNAEVTFQKRQEAIADKQKKLEASQFRPGSAEHERAVSEITKEMTEFETDAKTLQRKFALENSKIMYDTFQDIKTTIGKYAAARSIAQVTDYREFTPDPADPQTVAEDMDQRLVWFSPSLNITRTIIGAIYAARGGQQVPEKIQAEWKTADAGGTAPRTATAPPAPVTPGLGVQR